MTMMINQQVVDRYRRNYELGNDIGEYHVRRHWELETALTGKLLRSNRAERWNVFSECYTELYAKLPWLNKPEIASYDYSPWSRLIGQKSRIFEIGSGKAQLLKYLVSVGHDCVATEITTERGAKHAADLTGLTWHQTDGVNLAQFEMAASYDVVISTQVVEHLHPDDILEHFSSAARILKVGGRYIFDTPHAGAGPNDLSLVFDLDRPVCMHLKEYDYLELWTLLKRAGFASVGAVLHRPRMRVGPYSSSLFLHYCCAWDWLIERIGISTRHQRELRRGFLLQRLFSVPRNIWLCATK